MDRIVLVSRSRAPFLRAARTLAAVTALAAVVACTRSETPISAEGEWFGTVTNEGNVTTVVNESGSVWGGKASLVEEASIGVEAGPDEYMLGSIAGVWADHEHILVADWQVPVVRVYDLRGNHLRDLGQQGQGPGEYTYPYVIVGDETGRVFVQDPSAGRFNVFSIDGEILGTWSARGASCCSAPSVPAPDGTLWVRTRMRDEETGETRYGIQKFGPDGPLGDMRYPEELDFEPVEFDVTMRGRTFSTPTPFSPRSFWVIAPSGAAITGASDRYHFEIQSAEGAVLAIEKYWTPVHIEAGEADWWRRLYVVSYRRELGDDWTWDGAEMPATKPAFSSFIPASDGAIWISREGPGERLPGCEDPLDAGAEAAYEAPCWRSSVLIDVFDAEGRFLGPVEAPSGIRASPSTLHVDGDRVVGVLEDDLGVITVKRWRLVTPDSGR